MPEPSWIFILAMVTFALALAFAVFSIARTRRDQKKDVETSVPRDQLARERRKTVKSRN